MPDQQSAQQQFGVNRGATGVALTRFQCLANESEVDVTINKPHEMDFGNVISQAGGVQERLGTSLLAIITSGVPPQKLIEHDVKELERKTLVNVRT
jgi:hypothetical protein